MGVGAPETMLEAPHFRHSNVPTNTANVTRNLISMALSGPGNIAISLLESCCWRTTSKDLDRWTIEKLILRGATYHHPATPRPHSEFQ